MSDEDYIERWETIAGVDIKALVNTRSPDDLRRIAARAAVASAEYRELDEELVLRAIELLRAEGADSDLQEELTDLAEQIDELAWDKQDEVDAGTADYAEYQSLFRRARAVAALAFALDEDVRANAPEALYEAYQALDQDDTELNAIIAQS